MNFPETNNNSGRFPSKRDREAITIEYHIMIIVATNSDGITFNELMRRVGLSSKLLHKYLDRLSDVIHKEKGIFQGWKGRPSRYIVKPKDGIFERIRKYEEFFAIRN